MSTKNRRGMPQRRVSQPPVDADSVPTVVHHTETPAPPAPEEALQLIQQIQDKRGAPLLTFVTAPEVTVRSDVVEQVYEQLRLIGHVPRIDLFLHSSGGQTEVPWRLITLIRDFADRFAVLIPGIAYSAATHLAMGADQIIMGPRSELSPVDPARAHPLLPSRAEGEPPLTVSVQDLRRCVDFVKSEVGIGSPDALAQVIVALFAKVHPLAIGAIQQSYDLARLISRKALSTHMDPNTDRDQIERIVNAFSDEFFSHGYWIGWQEAQQIGLKVVRADDDLWEMMWSLYRHYRSYFTLLRVTDAEREAARPIAWIDSALQRRILEEVYVLPEAQRAEQTPATKMKVRWLELLWQSAEPLAKEE